MGAACIVNVLYILFYKKMLYIEKLNIFVFIKHHVITLLLLPAPHFLAVVAVRLCSTKTELKEMLLEKIVSVRMC